MKCALFMNTHVFFTITSELLLFELVIIVTRTWEVSAGLQMFTLLVLVVYKFSGQIIVYEKLR